MVAKCFYLDVLSLPWGWVKQTTSWGFFFFLFLFDFEKKDTLREHLVPVEPKAFARVGTGSQLRF